MTKWILEESELTYGLPENRIIHGNALTVLKKFPPNSVDCIIDAFQKHLINIVKRK